TSRRFDQEDFIWSAVTWPASGSISGGRLSQPPRLEPRIYENDGSVLLPTPTASRSGYNQGGGSGRIGKIRYSMFQLAQRGELPNHPRGILNPMWIEQAMGYPIGWTELDHSVMQWFQLKRKKRSCA